MFIEIRSFCASGVSPVFCDIPSSPSKRRPCQNRRRIPFFSSVSVVSPHAFDNTLISLNEHRVELMFFGKSAFLRNITPGYSHGLENSCCSSLSDVLSDDANNIRHPLKTDTRPSNPLLLSDVIVCFRRSASVLSTPGWVLCNLFCIYTYHGLLESIPTRR